MVARGNEWSKTIVRSLIHVSVALEQLLRHIHVAVGTGRVERRGANLIGQTDRCALCH